MANADDNASAVPGDEPSSTVFALSLRLPQFSTPDPPLWLAQVNSQFTIGRTISQTNQFHHVAASLPPEIAAEVRDLVITPLASAPPDTLAAEPTKRSAVSEYRRLQQLIFFEQLGDRKPTQLLRRLQQLLGDKAASFDQAFLRKFFLQRLPSSVHVVLVPAQGLSLQKLAELADSITDVSYSTISLGAVPQPPTPPSSLPYRVDLQSLRDDFHAQVTRLTCQIAALSTSRSLSPSRRQTSPCLPHLLKPATAGITSPSVKQRVGVALLVPSRELPTTLQEAASGVTPENTRLFIIRDHIFGVCFLEDTGAELQRPYDGSSRALERTSKFSIVDIHGRTVTISIDSLKPAFTEDALPT
ncbi:uncharacterized protein LOC144134216 [Amblyomma americanum]